MKISKRSLPGFQKIPTKKEYALMTVYAWGYWLVIVKKK